MSSESSPEPPTDVDGYLQRAGLLADLGRYDEAAGEIGFAVALDPDSVAARIMLARVHLAADRPEQALAVIDAWADEPPNPWSAEATAAATPADADGAGAGAAARPGPPDRVALLVVRGLALIDLRRYADAARLATDLLATYPDDAYAQRSGAAILAGSRNGQPALNAAWRGVELAPQDAQAHLVLGLVGARLELFDLAHRAYGEALRLDPLIGEAQHDVGVIHLEQRRYAAELAVLAERATAMAPPPPPAPARSSRWAPAPPGSVPMDPRLERPPTAEEELRRLVLIGAGYSMIAAVTVACLAGSAASRGWAVVAALGGFVLVWVLARRVPGRITEVVSQLADRRLTTAVYAAAAAPVLIFCYAAIATPWLLVSAIVAAAVAQFMVLRSATARPPDQR
ncbi:tetratricopeptide repeat protein [Solwaraspora sp. WMMD937]|uniref:tetratricopeptide repeat protein n=1 Tax=Solwaraspora sp. WMMD937 TaxID=3016090 RepID=UPI002499D26A|nr:tetratricopeptide repeat protein [Solwaraspora sp. WMMD937]WFE22279.1 tetratricopeptide repeat protein [Solwaraspora sp. WMMD937]